MRGPEDTSQGIAGDVPARIKILAFASLALSVFGQEPIELYRGDARELIVSEHPAHVHQPLVQTIVDELQGSGRCTSTGQSGLRASAVIDRILEGYYGGRSDAFWTRPDSWPGPER